MTTLAAVEVEEIEAAEAVEKCTKLQSPEPDVGEAHAGDYAGGILCGGDTTVEARYPLISTGVSRMTETQ